MSGLKIGLLGGSFNPAHDAHVHISLAAIRRFNLDQVWWLVSPQNPLKPTCGMADYDTRLTSARNKARHPKIHISDFENSLGQSYTANTLRALQAAYRSHHFVWLMGADNLAQIPNWYQWQEIFDLMPVAVFDRPDYTYQALFGKAAEIYAKYRVFTPHTARPDKQFSMRKPPCWIFIPETKHKLSSTDIRKSRFNAGKACS